MWIMGTDFFLSVVRKDCSPGQLLVRARREGDIEKVFGQVEVQRDTTADYLFRARIDEEAVASAMRDQLLRIDYGNYKSAANKDMHDALLTCWHALADLQDPPPYSGRRLPTQHLQGRPAAEEAQKVGGEPCRSRAGPLS
jgi:hypothetical protein